MATSRGNLFDPVLVSDLISKVKGKSSLAKLSGQTPIPFNGLNYALKKIKNVEILGLKPFRKLIGTISVPQIPLLAKGGVITSPTIAMMGEYAGAKTNPEIVTPQSILRETISSSNDELINALLNATGRIIKAINDSNVTLEGDAKGMFNIIKKEADNYTYRTGKPAFI